MPVKGLVTNQNKDTAASVQTAQVCENLFLDDATLKLRGKAVPFMPKFMESEDFGDNIFHFDNGWMEPSKAYIKGAFFSNARNYVVTEIIQNGSSQSYRDVGLDKIADSPIQYFFFTDSDTEHRFAPQFWSYQRTLFGDMYYQIKMQQAQGGAGAYGENWNAVTYSQGNKDYVILVDDGYHSFGSNSSSYYAPQIFEYASSSGLTIVRPAEATSHKGAIKCVNGTDTTAVRFAVIYKERLFVAGEPYDADKGTRPSIVRFSSLNNILDFVTGVDESGKAGTHSGGAIDIYNSDSIQITALAVAFDSLFVFTDGNISVLRGSGVTDFSLVRDYYTMCGTTVHFNNTIACNNTIGFFLGSDRKLYQMTPTGTSEVGKPVQDLLNSIPVEYPSATLQKPQGTLFSDKYCLAAFINGKRQVLVYNFRTGTFELHDISVGKWLSRESDKFVMMYYDNDLSTNKQTYDTTLYRFPYNDDADCKAQTSDDIVPFKYVTPMSDFGYPGCDKTVTGINFSATGKGTIYLRLRNEKGKIKQKIITLTTSYGDTKSHNKSLIFTGRKIQAEIENIDAEYLEISAIDLIMEVEDD